MGKYSFRAFLAPPEIFFFKKNTHFTLKIPVLWGVLGMITKCRPQKGRRKSHRRPEFGSEWMRGHPNRQKTLLPSKKNAFFWPMRCPPPMSHLCHTSSSRLKSGFYGKKKNSKFSAKASKKIDFWPQNPPEIALWTHLSGKNLFSSCFGLLKKIEFFDKSPCIKPP